MFVVVIRQNVENGELILLQGIIRGNANQKAG